MKRLRLLANFSARLALAIALFAASVAPALAQTAGNNSTLAVNGSSAAGSAPFAGGLHAICVLDGAGLCRGPLSDAAGVLTVGVRPPGTAETCSSGNVANAAVACTLAASAGKTTYVTGLVMSSNGATAALGVTCTITGAITGTISFTYVYPAIASITNQPLVIAFPTPVPASAANTTLAGSCPASGAGGTIAAFSMFGFQL